VISDWFRKRTARRALRKGITMTERRRIIRQKEEELDDLADQMSVTSVISILVSELGKPSPLAV